MTKSQSVAELFTQEVARQTKKLNRRSSWISKIMESQWPSYLLPITRVIEALGLSTETEFKEYQSVLKLMLAEALNQYRAGADKICEKSGLMPSEIPDATRYAIYLSSLVDQVAMNFECAESEQSLILHRRAKPLKKRANDIELRASIYELLCSPSLQKYMRSTGNEQTIIDNDLSRCA